MSGKPMTNRFNGVCRNCFGIVPAGEGTVRRVGKEWVVECDPADCGSYDKYTDTVHPFSSEAIDQW